MDRTDARLSRDPRARCVDRTTAGGARAAVRGSTARPWRCDRGVEPACARARARKRIDRRTDAGDAHPLSDELERVVRVVEGAARWPRTRSRGAPARADPPCEGARGRGRLNRRQVAHCATTDRRMFNPPWHQRERPQPRSLKLPVPAPKGAAAAATAQVTPRRSPSRSASTRARSAPGVRRS